MADLSVKGFDVKTYAENGGWLQLLHPVSGEELGVDEDKPCRIKVLGADATGYEEALAHSAALRANDPAAKKRGSRRITGKMLMEEREKTANMQAHELAAVTVDWENVEWQGESLEFSQKNAEMIYSAHEWIRQQVVEFFQDRTNFLPDE